MAQRPYTIAVMAPSRALERSHGDELREICAPREASGAVRVIVNDQCFARHGHFAGPDVMRAETLLALANDPAIDAIWFARGGYGAGRILPRIEDQLGEHARAKRYLGYSDCGMLLAALYRWKIGTPMHGPMPADLARKSGAVSINRALDALLGSLDQALPPRAVFNLTVLSHLCGTPWMPDLSGHELIVEDVGEYEYAIDRCFFTLASQPWFSQLAGLRIGRFSAIPENEIAFEATPEDIAKDWCTRVGISFLGHADVGHDAGNTIIAFG